MIAEFTTAPAATALAKRLLDEGCAPCEPLALQMNGQTVIETTIGAAARLGERVGPAVLTTVELPSAARSATRALLHARVPTTDGERRGRAP